VLLSDPESPDGLAWRVNPKMLETPVDDVTTGSAFGSIGSKASVLVVL
jgi:hypothetical protein